MLIKEFNYEKVIQLLPERDPWSHKSHYGRVLMLCGSKGYTGAAALAAQAAMRCGTGLLFLGVPESVYPILAVKLWEPVVFPLPDDDTGILTADALGVIHQKLGSMDAVLIGCGSGCTHGTRSMVQTVLESFPGPVVLDADGINVLQGHKDIVRGRTGITILTPHMGEFRRIYRGDCKDRITAAAEMAQQLGCIVLLKGHETVITDGQCCYINRTGNPGMAVGGSGDVLSGIIVSLLGQGLPPLEATAAAAWLHGAAGDLCANEIGQYGMLPTDMIQVLPRLLK